MSQKKKAVAKQPYLTKRRLVSAAKSGIRKAAAETMEVMGYVIIAEDGWLVKKYADGRTEKISPIERANPNESLVLD
ncbi:hypothetical protein [Flavisolibacter ginsenosidimutans]|uniref:Uncharacterized protein n=1 Tax=Flavisolibacter ginsenosidimutans TaxID=661481 RepID=A0A5B8ULJ9_9BACT|nr:hypothetical protein [Flavisolibacter ginsenosidimutans]QEC57581.1 hypothetical protein FSB75_17280 [Flavisolibacter ginsenosidimutans]